MFTRAHIHPCPEPDWSSKCCPILFHIYFNIILPPSLGLAGGHIPSHFTTRAQYTLLFFPVLPVFPAYFNILYFITRIMLWEYQSLCLSVWNIVKSLVISSVLGPYFFFLIILFLNTLSLSSSLTMRDQVSQPYWKDNRQLYFFIFYIANWNIKDPGPNGSRHSLIGICC
jgi:hypothetical protein